MTYLAQNLISLLCYSLLPLSILYLLLQVLYAAVSPLRRLPGPFAARFTRLWIFREIYYGRMHNTNVELHKIHGPVVRIAPNEYSIDDPDSVQLIYGSKGGFIKGPWYLSSAPPGTLHTSVFVDPNVERHAYNRRRISHAYSMTSLIQLEPFINDCNSLLRTRLDEMAAAEKLVDIPHWTQCYAFDVIGAITVGHRFGFLDSGKDIGGIMESLHEALLYAARVGVFSEWHYLLFYLNAMLAPSTKGMVHTVRFIQKHIDRGINEKRTLPKPDDKTPVDFITRFLLLKDTSPEKVSKQDIESAAMNNFGAGSDTTSVSLCGILYFLCKHPGVLLKLRNELDSMLSRGEITEPITYNEAQKLLYLQAVIKESLRLHPPAGLSMGRIVPQGGAIVAGVFFPAGTVIGINSWVAHANQEIFGTDADKFRPERWLEEPEVVKKRDAYFMTFGSGPRTCLGKNISLLEISKLIPTLVLHYDFKLENPERPLKTQNDWFVLHKDIKCRVTLRSVNR